MFIRLVLLACLFSFSFNISAQTIRTYNGTNNNLVNTEYGSASAVLVTKTTNGFSDQISEPGGANRPHPRVISNELFSQYGIFSDPLNLSDFLWVYGQFIDHDITAVGNNLAEFTPIMVDFPDPHFNPSGQLPNVMIPMFRSLEAPGTGTSINNPRRYTNSITAFIDGSAVYGSDEFRADYLRLGVEGKLRVSSGNLLPWNTVTGETGAIIDPGAPHMDNENPFNDELFIAGDARANENPLLVAFHTLFVREHNRLCDEIKIANPGWTDEQIYQHARKFVGGFIQNITYSEWLPEMGVNLPAYTAYDSSIDPGISNVFSAAAFRMGHTLLNSNIVRVNNEGDTIPEGNLLLRDGFFQPHRILDEGGLDPLFKGMAIQVEQNLDAKVVDDVRNFLFGAPGAGGLDLAAININRGRERGLPDFNTVRGNFGLGLYNSFSDLCSDQEVNDVLTNLYGTIDHLDPWVGMLAEDHMDGALFGETIMKIMEDQFLRLRDGDRFYFENDPVLTADEKAEIRNTTLRDIIMRNTGISIMQDNVFQAMPHDSICGAQNSLASLSGTVLTESGAQVNNVSISVVDNDNQPIASGNATNGIFTVDDVTSCEHIFVGAAKDDILTNGVNTLDLILIAKNILFIDPFTSPYKVIAADVNNNGFVNVGDLLELRKAILVINTEFTNNTSWRFVDANYVFNDPQQAAGEDFPELINQGYLSQNNSSADFIAIKVGDVSGNANPASLEPIVSRNYTGEELIFKVRDQVVQKGKTYTINFDLEENKDLIGFQFTLDYKEDYLKFLHAGSNTLVNVTKDNFGVFENTGQITSSWHGDQPTSKQGILSFTFEATKNGLLSDLVELNSSLTKAEAYNEELEIMDVGISFEESGEQTAQTFYLAQNQPNPFTGNTRIEFNLPQSVEATLNIYGVTGELLKSYTAIYQKGRNDIEVNTSEFLANGIMYYTLESPFGIETKKMIFLD